MLRLPYLAMRVLLTAIAFAGFYFGSLLLSWVILPWQAWRQGGDRTQRALRSQAIVQRGFLFFHDYARIAGFIELDPRTVALQLPAGPCVVIANHPTLIDVTALLAALGRISCVVKSMLFRSVLTGPLLRSCWHINGGGGDASSGAGVILEAIDRLAAGMPVLIFPEGTRSPVGGLRTFKRGAFEIACRAGAPIVPVLLSCDPPMLSKHAPWYKTPNKSAKFTMIQLPTLDAALWHGDTKAMAADVQALYQRCLDGDVPAAWGPSRAANAVLTGS